ncbi:hypothetical protein WMY93_002217 [Mugilogobius chulae]|uniref:B30.2/SPRY domain-containing protein n=1 Tax=Mugilogobius chulae TaxID=88201 RepID=A0AAW0PT61_9GOBI
MIDFVVVSSDLWPHVLDSRVKRGAELLTDYHLVTLRASRIHTGPRSCFDEMSWFGRNPNEFKPRLSPDEAKIRDEYLKYYKEITLDQNTANAKLFVFDRSVTCMTDEQDYPDHPDRFSHEWQVLGRESLTGRCYWEIKWTGDWIRVAVSYKDIPRKGGPECRFGDIANTWALHCDRSSYVFRSNNVETQISGPVTSRIGIYLDHSDGVLTFYSLSDTNMRLLHRVQTNFTQPLLAGIGFYKPDASALFCKLN